jgi:predicted RNA binding protein YcfA (HicA-like mRNA interferase family)/predicted RNase H-like HicB family nuclease
VFM